MKTIALILFTLGMAGRSFAAESSWVTSLPDAVEQATNENKLLLLDFTGSDWCGWCQKLDAEIFSKAEFLNYARENLVLVQVDFPMHKSQSGDLKKANRELKKKYGIEGYPTVVVIKPDGRVMWDQRGYVESSPASIIAAMDQCRKAAGLNILTAAAPPAKPAAPPKPITVVSVPQPATLPQKSGDEPKLKAILYSSTHASVVLDGGTYEEGDIVYGMRVIKIARDKVTVEWQGQVKVLKMN